MPPCRLFHNNYMSFKGNFIDWKSYLYWRKFTKKLNNITMQNHYLKPFASLLCIIFLLWNTPMAMATHMMGADLTYECTAYRGNIGNAQFFRDCNGIDPEFSYDISLESAACIGGPSSANLPLLNEPGLINPEDITPLCPGEEVLVILERVFMG